MDAARADSVEMVEALISTGADINAKNGEGKTAYIQAGGRSSIARLLNRAQQKTLSDLIAAAQNGQIERVHSLSQAGVDVNTRTRDGRTALMNAAGRGQIEIVQALLDGGADVSLKTGTGITASMATAVAGHSEIVELLKQAGTP
ncbi:MAG: ankyrin repeat domain-containing protein [Acidobacteriota bacterium]|nr:ankyrin repeat domain-containing protein [Acidobacteriota bacterium]